MPLSERECAILEFERTWWTGTAAKDTAVLERFELSLERYDQILAALADLPEALEHDPLVIRRLQRDRSRRHAARLNRSAERIAHDGT